MKEKYLKPYADIEMFNFAEVISTSVEGDIQPGDTDVSFGD